MKENVLSIFYLRIVHPTSTWFDNKNNSNNVNNNSSLLITILAIAVRVEINALACYNTLLNL